VDERILKGKSLDGEAALAELTRRYFTSRGPATLNDFAWGSSLTASQCREGLTLVGNELESEVIDGKTYWFAAPLPRASASPKPRVDLVQGYEVLLDGRMIGKWKPVARRNSVVLKTVLNRALTRVERDALGAAIHAYTTFAGVPLTVARTRGK